MWIRSNTTLSLCNRSGSWSFHRGRCGGSVNWMGAVLRVQSEIVTSQLFFPISGSRYFHHDWNKWGSWQLWGRHVYYHENNLKNWLASILLIFDNYRKCRKISYSFLTVNVLCNMFWINLKIIIFRQRNEPTHSVLMILGWWYYYSWKYVSVALIFDILNVTQTTIR